MMCKVLIFGCIAAAILMTAVYGAPPTTIPSPIQKVQLLEASICDLKQLENFKNDFLDFYTPNDKQECIQKTLDCYLGELNVLYKALGHDDRIHLQNIQKNLEHLKGSNSSNLICKKCESSEKKKFPEFHKELISFLQSMRKEIM